MDTKTPAKCTASVQRGTYTWNARNTERQCGNPAGADGRCHRHPLPAPLTDEQRESFEAMRASILADLRMA